jgi:uncharacterized membrane protein YhaH (DUF805 family)
MHWQSLASVVRAVTGSQVGVGLSRRLFSFSGRMGRAAWWAHNVAAALALAGVLLLASLAAQASLRPSESVAAISQLLVGLACFWIALAALSAQVRRWHDRGKSGWWALLMLLPGLGLIWVIVEWGFLSSSRR